MKKLIIFCLTLCLFAPASDAAYVRDHMRKNGTYTMGYHRTRADKTRFNNYSTRGNRNPNTCPNCGDKQCEFLGYGGTHEHPHEVWQCPTCRKANRYYPKQQSK